MADTVAVIPVPPGVGIEVENDGAMGAFVLKVGAGVGNKFGLKEGALEP